MNKLNFLIIIIFSILIGLYIHFKYYNKLNKYNKLKFAYYSLAFIVIVSIISRFLQKDNDKKK
jgi:hypothetical protein